MCDSSSSPISSCPLKISLAAHDPCVRIIVPPGLKKDVAGIGLLAVGRCSWDRTAGCCKFGVVKSALCGLVSDVFDRVIVGIQIMFVETRFDRAQLIVSCVTEDQW